VLAQSAGGGLDVIEAGSVVEVEQAVNLREMPAKTPGKFGLANTLLNHGLIDAELGDLKGGGADRGATRRRRRLRERPTSINIQLKGGLKGVYGVKKGFILVFTLGHRFRDIGKGDQIAAFRLGMEINRIFKHGESHLRPSCFLMASTRPVLSSVACMGRTDCRPLK